MFAVLKPITKIPLAALLLLLVTGCNPQAKGFALPPGDAQAGAAAFVKLGCNTCHSVEGQIPQRETTTESTVAVVLGGRTTRVKTYGDLVTSIINPSHKLSRGTDKRTLGESGETLMPTYNSTMTVEEMLDLTSFLQESYTIWIPQYWPYYFP